MHDGFGVWCARQQVSQQCGAGYCLACRLGTCTVRGPRKQVNSTASGGCSQRAAADTISSATKPGVAVVPASAKRLWHEGLPAFCLHPATSRRDPFEERDCDGLGDHYPERKEKSRSGDCTIEREWKKDGDYKEERKCNGRARSQPMSSPPPVAYPPGIVLGDRGLVYSPGLEAAAWPLR